MSAKQLIGTIEQVEKHESNSREESNGDPWDDARAKLSSLKDRLGAMYRQAAAPGAPSDEDLRDAFGTLAAAWEQVAATFSIAMKDPQLREQIKTAAGGLAAAMGDTLTRLGAEITEEEN